MTEMSELDAAGAIMPPGNDITTCLYKEQVSIKGSKAIAEALKHENNKVEQLNLNSNHLGVERAMAIAEALKHENNRVENLELRNNEIDVEGAKAIAEALKHENSKIERFE